MNYNVHIATALATKVTSTNQSQNLASLSVLDFQVQCFLIRHQKNKNKNKNKKTKSGVAFLSFLLNLTLFSIFSTYSIGQHIHVFSFSLLKFDFFYLCIFAILFLFLFLFFCNIYYQGPSGAEGPP